MELGRCHKREVVDEVVSDGDHRLGVVGHDLVAAHCQEDEHRSGEEQYLDQAVPARFRYLGPHLDPVRVGY